MTEYREVLDFWFGELDDRGRASEERVKRWWTKSDEFDRELEERFDELRREVLAGEHDGWLQENDSLVAYIVVLDQFTRNIKRDTPQMYEADERALAATKLAVTQRRHQQLGLHHRVMAIMPLMHSEDVHDQELCIGLLQELAAQYPDIEQLKTNIDFAIKHRDIVERFGRFPHRNEILGRESTPEELEFLKQPGSSF